MEDLQDKIKTRLNTLIVERDNFVRNASRQVDAYNIAIGELQFILQPEPVKPDEKPAGSTEVP